MNSFPVQFHQPLWIFAGLGVSALLVSLYFWSTRKRQATLNNFASSQLQNSLIQNVSTTRKRIKFTLIVMAVFFLFVALARPQYGFRWVDVKRKGIDILIALDTSKSMLAQDIKPNRLERARYAILDFIEKLEGDRVGLMPFAGSAYLMCPLTLDYNAFESSLAAVTTDTIPKGGTNLAELIKMADETLNNNANHKILIVVTDGENLEGDLPEAARKAAENGMTIHTVGVGTPEGELIPSGTNNTFIKDDDGKYVRSRLDEKALSGISEITGGISVLLGKSGEGLEKIYQEKLKLIPKEELKERRKKVPIEKFEYPLGLAILLLCIEFLIRESNPANRRKTIKISVFLPFFLLIATSLFSGQSYAGKGEDAYAEGSFLKAGEIYREMLRKNPFNHRLHYNLGTVSYKNNMIDEAISSFKKSLESTDTNLQEKAYYNLGNSHFQKGKKTVQEQPAKTIEQWKQAIKSYDASLALNPENKAAKKNRDIVQKLLDELKKQQQEQQDSSDQNQENKDQEQNKDQQNNDSENKSDQSEDSENKQSEDQKEKDQSSKDNKENQDSQNKDSKEDEKQQQDQKNEKKPQEQSDKNSKPSAASKTEEQQDGQMSQLEARRLLDALKDNEGELNFVPHSSNENVEKDW